MSMLDIVASFQGLTPAEVVRSLRPTDDPRFLNPPCICCDPYQYRAEERTFEGDEYLMCRSHRHMLGPQRRPPNLPFGWQASWKRGIWG